MLGLNNLKNLSYNGDMKIVPIFISFVLLFFAVSCDGGKVYTTTEMWSMAQDFDPSIELVPITKQERRILCTNYGEGCVKNSGRRVLVRKVELIVVQFETEKQAKKEAMRLNQYYARNWLFDDVTNEPVLVDFVERVYNAQNPNERR